MKATMTAAALAMMGMVTAIPSKAVEPGAQPAGVSDTIRVGQPLPRWDRVTEGTSRYLRYRDENGRRIAMDIWTRTVSFESDPGSGQKKMRIRQTWNGATLPMERTVDSWFEIATFRPLSHRTERVANGRTAIAGFLFSPDAVRGDTGLPDNGQAALNLPTAEPVFNFETDMEMLRTLPWREGYSARIHFYHPGGDPPAWYVYAVTGSESLQFGGRGIPCWIVAIDYGSLGAARFWIDKETGTVIKAATTGPDIPGTLYKVLLPPE